MSLGASQHCHGRLYNNFADEAGRAVLGSAGGNILPGAQQPLMAAVQAAAAATKAARAAESEVASLRKEISAHEQRMEERMAELVAAFKSNGNLVS